MTFAFRKASVMIFEGRSELRMHDYFVKRSTEVARLFVSHDYGSVNSKRAHPPPSRGICHFVVKKPQILQIPGAVGL